MPFGARSRSVFQLKLVEAEPMGMGRSVAAAGRRSSHSYYFLALSHHISATAFVLAKLLEFPAAPGDPETATGTGWAAACLWPRDAS